jgi:hypothetical protein
MKNVFVAAALALTGCAASKSLAPASPLRHIRNQQEFSMFEIDGKRVGRQA